MSLLYWLQWIWKYTQAMYVRHPVVLFSALLFLMLATVLLAALFPPTPYTAWLLSKKSRRTWLPFLLVLLLACGLPPAFWYFGQLVPKENVYKTRSKYVFGIDVSQNQRGIDWDKVKGSDHRIRFVIIRATMGKDGRDTQFSRNWEGAAASGFIRGVYHYYRPEEDPESQFRNFSSLVSIGSGDLPPVLDVETLRGERAEVMRRNVRRWLELAEMKYKVRPIVYTGRNFYLNHLKGHIDEYPLWIAAYDGEHRVRSIGWLFHQFSESIIIHGIRENVDGNNFRGTLDELRALCLD